ncbi:hypothetical protein AB1Y20_014184 [Prymnesium parvum]|uniref:Phospholipase B-like n=1 Tax=Prymnesium parvum TaxID=97485 RepID=A0AB34IG35_PRYPA
MLAFRAVGLAAAVCAQGGLVPSGGMVPGGGGGGGGGRRFGGYVHVSEPPVGFFIAGSSLLRMNGVYGPRLPAHAVAEQWPELAVGVRHGAYRGESGWWLVHLQGEEREEWVLIDEAARDRFAHEGGTLVPGSGTRWAHVSREPRRGRPPEDAAPGAAPSGGGESSSRQLRAASPSDRERELPWQVIGIRDVHLLEQARPRMPRGCAPRPNGGTPPSSSLPA